MAELFSGISDTIMDGIQAILYATIYKLLYYLAVGCCWIINLLYSMFEVMAGLTKVSYDGDYEYLINIFFSNTTVSKVYWGMALIGLTAGFAFAIAAVIKKLFDLSEKEKRSYGQILRGLFKSTLTILCMSLIITMVLNATTLLMQQINYVFINADDLGEEQSITYTDEEYAAMTRVLSTIGNFSLNPSYNNRYNLNKCFNEIRLDLQYLKLHGVFDFHYVTKDMEGNTIATWQSALQKIANSASLERDLSLDVYHESVSNSILQTMDLLKVNGSFKPLEEYQRHYQPSRSSLPMDRLLFLMASMRAAKNDEYNLDPSLTDPLRGAYYYGEKSIYDLDTVNEDFDIGIAAFDYVVLFLTCYKMLETLATIILNCVGRIFNMLLLYLISPLVIAVSSLDDGAKFKQWTTAFIVQSLSVFGTVVSMRVLLLFMPVVVDNKLVLFENPIANLLTKLVIILGAFEVAEKATNLITGILADNAGWQSITAGDMSSAAKTAVGYGLGAAKGVGGLGLSAAGLGVKGGLKAAGFGAKVATGVGLTAGYGVYGLGKGAVVGTKALANKISAWRNSGKNDGAGGGGTSGTVTGGTANDNGGGSNQQTDNLPENLRGDDNGDITGTVNDQQQQLPENNHDTGNTETNTVDKHGQQNPEGNNQQNTQVPNANREIGNTQGTNGGVTNPPTTNRGNRPTQNTTGGVTNPPTTNRGNRPTQNTTGVTTNPPTMNRGNGPTQNTTGVTTNPPTTNRGNGPTQNPTGGTTNPPTMNRGNGPAQNTTGGTTNTTTMNRGNGPAQNTTGVTTNPPTMNRGNGPAQNTTGVVTNPPTMNRGNGPTQNPTGGTTNPTTMNRGNGSTQNPTGGTTNTTTMNRGNGPTQNPTGGTTNTTTTNRGNGPTQNPTGVVTNPPTMNRGNGPAQNTNVVGEGNQHNAVPAQPQVPTQGTNLAGGGNQTGTVTIAKDAPYTPSAGITARAQAIENAQAAAAAPGSNVTQPQRPSRPLPKTVREQIRNNNNT